HQPTPGEQLVWGNAMPTSHQAYRHTRLEGLFDHANLLRGRPAPTTLNRRDDLNAIGQIGHRHGCMPHTCQVGDRVRSVRGLSQSPIKNTTKHIEMITTKNGWNENSGLSARMTNEEAAHSQCRCTVTAPSIHVRALGNLAPNDLKLLSLPHHNAMNIASFILPCVFGLLPGLLLQLHVLL